MSEAITNPVPLTEATEPTATTAAEERPEMNAVESSPAAVETPAQPAVVDEPAKEAEGPSDAVTFAKDESTPQVVAAPDVKVENTVEPITEGVLSYKGPGLLKSLVPSKKEFWLSDAPVEPQHLHLYLRGEKPEIANGVVAWASQTGKGLLFFNKKSETNRTNPQNVLPLYDATDLQKASPHEITFKLHGHTYTLKATSDAERDGWFLSLERAVEIGKADKESVRESEGYKAEIEKLNKPNTTGTVAAAAAGTTAVAAADKTEEPKRAGSSGEDAGKKQKSRSTSRGIFNRLQGKKEEAEAKKEEKKEEKEEKKEAKEEAKAEKEAEKTGEVAAIPAVAVAGGEVFDAPSVAERAVGAPVEERAVDPAAESGPVVDSAVKVDEKPKPSKRGSIFGRFQTAFSPSREKDQKEAELKPDVPPKDAAAGVVPVSETAPQLPEPAADTTDLVAAPAATETTEPTSGKPAEAAKEQLDTIAPANEKKTFLSGLPFMNKRDRSVSPSTAMKEAPKKEETPAVPAKDEVVAAEPDARSEEPSKALPEVEKPAATEETTSPTNKRQSVFSGLSRRASKAFGSRTAPTKTAPVTETKKEEEEESKAVTDPTSVINADTTKPAEPIVESTPTVTASA